MIVVVSKIGRVWINYEKIVRLFEKSRLSNDGIPFVPISGWNGDNMVKDSIKYFVIRDVKWLKEMKSKNYKKFEKEALVFEYF